jgi:pimeloyl-ACP methyl ester carboxylesterase
MAQMKSNGITIEYEVFGKKSGSPLLLIGGLGDQLIHWDEEFCRNLADAGCYVIVFDNRDSGLSSSCDFPYSIKDMADDAAGLLEGIGIERAHVCGASMGGMITQTLAIEHPSHVASLILVYTTSGKPNMAPPDPAVMELLIQPAPTDKSGYIEYMVGLYRALAGKGFPFDEEWVRSVTENAYNRSRSPNGTTRQMMAIQKQKDRRADLSRLSLPALIIHGTDDPLLPVEAAIDLSEAIKGAELRLIEGMGHDLPHGKSWEIAGKAILDHIAKVDLSRKP